MFLVVNRRKNLLMVCLAVVLVIIISGMYFFHSQSVKADKSNAMQVVKMVEEEPAGNIDFFTEYRIERDKMRSERTEILRNSIKETNDEEHRQSLREKILSMVQEKKQETEMESLIKAKGFADALIFCSDKSISAIIKTEILTKEDVMQVADIIMRITNAKPEDITISAKN